MYASLGFLIPLLLIELWVYIPTNYLFFHLEKIIATGSDHMEIISGNGFNLWTWIYSDQNISSRSPLIGFVSPMQIGLFLFFTYFVAISSRLISLKSISFGTILLYIGIINLGMNVFFTGTHERYLYHCYPFLVIGILSDFNFSKNRTHKNPYKILWFTLLCATIYGAFVFGVLMKTWKEGYFYQTLIAHRITALIHFVYLIVITWFFFQQDARQRIN